MSKVVRAWMMMEATGGQFPLPDSRQAYLDNAGIIEYVIPPKARLNADGTWTLYPTNDFVTELPTLAASLGDKYLVSFDPGHWGDTTNIETVIGNSSLWATSASGMISMATGTDGVVYDAVRLETQYLEDHGDYIAYLSAAVRAAGIDFEIAFQAVTEEHEPYVVDLDVIADAADHLMWYTYDWWTDPWEISPYWWVRSSVENIVQHMDPRNVSLGIPTFSTYLADKTQADRTIITYDSAEDLIEQYSATLDWMESYNGDLVYESYADLNSGRVWVSDGEGAKYQLALVDEFGLAGLMVFCPCLGDNSVMEQIGEWRTPFPMPKSRRVARRARRTNWREFVR